MIMLPVLFLISSRRWLTTKTLPGSTGTLIPVFMVNWPAHTRSLTSNPGGSFMSILMVNRWRLNQLTVVNRSPLVRPSQSTRLLRRAGNWWTNPQWYTATASGDQDVIVTVKRIVTEPEEPGTKPEKPGINPGTPGNGQVTGTVNNRPATTASQPKAKLPQTGNGQETLVTASGLAVLSLLGLAGLKKKHD